MQQGIGRRWLVLALVAALGLSFAALAGGKTKNKTFSSGTVDKEFGEEPTAVTQDIEIKKKRSKVKDVDVGVRISHTYDADVELTLFGPDGTSVDLSSNNGQSGDDYGSGPESCDGTLTVFNDEATTSIPSGSAPFDAQYKPEEPLSNLDRSKLKGTWRLVAHDDFAPQDDGTLHCFELDVKYKKKKRN